MTYRRRNRWFRRLAVGLAFATFAAPAAARPDANGGRAATVTAGGWAGAVNDAGIPLSAGIPSGNESLVVLDPYLSDVFVRPGEALAGPDGGVAVSHEQASAPAVSNADSIGSAWTLSRTELISVGIGALALALALGLVVGYARRPRIAGL